ncbi:phosphatase PAP2 family protein [candidate division KSB1 bacterium]|nr:phosphatase PAP2 family protein [candidate division KSB1 bacterium]
MISRNRLVAVILFVIVTSWQTTGHAQGLQASQNQRSFKSLASKASSDVLYIFAAPSRLSSRSGLKLLALTGVTTGFMTILDQSIDDDFIERDDLYVKPGIGLAKIGDVYDRISSKYVLAGLSASMLTGGLIFKDKKLLETTRLMVESYLISGAIAQLGKRVFGRARPYTGEGPSKFEPFKFRGARDRRSFPSGHATSAFSMMTVLAKQYDQWWIKIPAYTVAISVAMQRMDSRNHWGADVIVGGAIGYSVGNALVNKYKQQSNSLTMNPYIFGNRVGIMFSF